MKERKDFVKIKAVGDDRALCGPNYEYHFKAGQAVEIDRARFLSSIFDDIREHLEVVEDPSIVPDPAPRGKKE